MSPTREINAATPPAPQHWIDSVFSDQPAETTWQAIAHADEPADADVARRQAIERQLADCDDKLGKYRAALEAGADPITVAGG